MSELQSATKAYERNETARVQLLIASNNKVSENVLLLVWIKEGQHQNHG